MSDGLQTAEGRAWHRQLIQEAENHHETLTALHAAESKLDRLRAKHHEEPVPEHEFNQGFEMVWCGYCHAPWPCPTVKIIDE